MMLLSKLRLKEFVITWGVWGELVNDVFPAKEESKGAFGKEWHAIKAHLKGTKISETLQMLRDLPIYTPSH